MNTSGSECSSGCESGWTMYLNNSPEDQYNTNNVGFSGGNRVFGDTNKDYGSKGKVLFSSSEEQDEDLSMISDASSGPPHFHHLQDFNAQNDQLKKGKQRKKTEEPRNCYLDDTASSPAITFPIENVGSYKDRSSMEHAPGISETHFKGKSVVGKHFGFLKSSGKGTPKKFGSVKDRNWK